MSRLALVLTEGFADWECALLMALARQDCGMEIAVATPGGKPVTSIGGLRAAADLDCRKLTAGKFDALVLCGGTLWTTQQAPDLTGLVGSFDRERKVVAGICAGVLPLLDAGCLKGRGHTSNFPGFLREARPAYGEAATYRDVPHAVRDGHVVTAPGTAPVSFAIKVLEALGADGTALSQELMCFSAEHISVKAAAAAA
ncbi:hypothetical protein BJF92_21320 [Rhizobium rhizosphaerae]|uniref:DJ-1/PfpI domain-containing protein n=1 Tax=Xaviernesmea rhizosphaerae TaxID=1672749 RepID=A0A1Q9ANT0_9HYPH|nr:DJ-1/PfpI family protein [Xaviernesmea rhizosphaerae]OLP57049.1 hypothetical protein BJF92_21320 [Xaviernesmea rhizosphaerae]OQP87106.1 hypothetical protein BTR14_06670 [Xaviernesmea rhizosphaerae]